MSETTGMVASAESPFPRRVVYTLLIVVAAATAAGRILSLNRAMPTFADNDRSRWATVRSLVDEGTYAIGRRLSEKGPNGRPIDQGIIAEEGWNTIDKVLRPDTQQFYSSKPPLLATIAAGEYWLLKHIFGWSIVGDCWQVVCTILLTFNWLPMVLYLVLLAPLVERYGLTDWGRLYVFTAGCFATLLTPFLITLNNHTVATCSALFAVYPLLSIWYEEQRHAVTFFLTGFFTGFTAANELPAATMLAAIFCLLAYRFPLRALLFFGPGAVVAIAAFLWTNYLAVGQFSPAYSEFGTVWYEYEGSAWTIRPGEVKHGIDWAYQTEGSLTYAFHVLFGHHGWFSLSPIYLLALAGVGNTLLWGKRKQAALAPKSAQNSRDYSLANLKMLAALLVIVSGAAFGFYIFGVNERNRNYGGWTGGLRWLMWLTPLWLLSMLPAADWLASRNWGRRFGYFLLAVSIFSASYASRNPWRHPWIYDLMESRGWINY
jgi:hypothetical protein